MSTSETIMVCKHGNTIFIIINTQMLTNNPICYSFNHKRSIKEAKMKLIKLTINMKMHNRVVSEAFGLGCVVLVLP